MKGFTLIELLAVIVILAIILLIATPMVLGVIDSAKEKAAHSSAVMFVRQIEQQHMMAQYITSQALTLNAGVVDATSVNVSELPDASNITLDAQGRANGTVEYEGFEFTVTAGDVADTAN